MTHPRDTPDSAGDGSTGDAAERVTVDPGSLQTLFSLLDGAAIAFERDEPLSWWTDGLRTLTRFDDECLSVRRATDLVDPADRARFAAGVNRALDEGETRVSTRIRTLDDTLVPVDVRLVRAAETGSEELLFATFDEADWNETHFPELPVTELALEETRTGVWEWDAQTDDVRWTEAVEEIFDVDDDFDGSCAAFIDLFHPDDRQRVQDDFASLIENRDDSFEADYRYQLGEEGYGYVETRGHVVYDDGEPTRVVGTITDVTHRRERERTHRDREERLRTVVEEAPVVMFALDDDGVFTFSEGRGLDTIGLAPGDVVGRSVFDLYEDHPQIMEDAARALAGEEVHSVVDVDGIVFETWYRPVPRDVDSGDRTIAIAVDVTEQRWYEAALRENEERLRTVIENVPVVLFAIDSDGVFTLSEGRGLSKLGASPGEAIGESIFDWMGDYPDALASVRRALDGEAFHARHEIDDLHFETWYQPMFDDGEVTGVIGVSMDVTRRVHHERALTALQTAAREMLHAETREEVAELTVDTSASMLDLPGVAIYLFDETDNVLRPAAHSVSVPNLVGEPTPFKPGESITWQVFTTGETRVFDDVRESEHVYNPDTKIRSGLYAPLGDHGVLIGVSDEPGVFDEEAVELASTFAATTQAALDRITRETDLRERERELERQTEELERLNETTGLLRDVEHLLVLADSREEVERGVCERLADSEQVAMAWIGGLDESQSAVVPSAHCGTERGYFERVSLSTTLHPESATLEPSVAAATSGDVVSVTNVAESLRKDEWRAEALSRGYNSVVAVPLVYRGHSYGVLTVYATRQDAFDGTLQSVLEELAGTVAYAINAIETRRGLLTRKSTELELTVSGSDDLLQRLANHLDCTLEFEGAVDADDVTHLFVSVQGADAAAVETYLDDVVGVVGTRRVHEGDGTTLFEVMATEPLFPSAIAEQGAVPVSIRATPDGITAVVEFLHTTGVRAFVEALRARYPGLELTARRNRERPVRTLQTNRALLSELLTERQRQALETAYLGGFFDSPRDSTGQELAASLGITQPTFTNHLRAAQRKVLDLLLGPDTLDT